MSEKKKLSKECNLVKPHNWEDIPEGREKCMCKKCFSNRKKEKQEVIETIKKILKEGKPVWLDTYLEGRVSIERRSNGGIKCYVVFNFRYGKQTVFVNFKAARHLIKYHGLKVNLPKRLEGSVLQNVIDILNKFKENLEDKAPLYPLLDYLKEEGFEDAPVYSLVNKFTKYISPYEIEDIIKGIKNSGY